MRLQADIHPRSNIACEPPTHSLRDGGCVASDQVAMRSRFPVPSLGTCRTCTSHDLPLHFEPRPDSRLFAQPKGGSRRSR
jgi:hypothetical protein